MLSRHFPLGRWFPAGLPHARSRLSPAHAARRGSRLGVRLAGAPAWCRTGTERAGVGRWSPPLGRDARGTGQSRSHRSSPWPPRRPVLVAHVPGERVCAHHRQPSVLRTEPAVFLPAPPHRLGVVEARPLELTGRLRIGRVPAQIVQVRFLDRAQDHLVHRAIVANPTPPVHRPATRTL
jgi:hypothetical protein